MRLQSPAMSTSAIYTSVFSFYQHYVNLIFPIKALLTPGRVPVPVLPVVDPPYYY